MSLSRKINENKLLVLPSLTVVVLVAGYLSYGATKTALGPGKGSIRAYFTTDDGKSWFEGDARDVPPFTHEGHEAVRAQVRRCNGKEFVAYLERYTTAAKAVLEKANQAANGGPKPNLGELMAASTTGKEVRRPGEAAWYNIQSQKGIAVTSTKCNDGSYPEPSTE